ncbi:MAG: protein-disulfide reductase DsbD domain-containing protein, partial [Pseudomonadota bacterium]
MLRVLASLFVLLAVLTPVRAAEVATGHARSDLVLARKAAAPGGTALIAFRQQLETGWHVYWKNSGTTGQPLSLTWSAPEGYAVGDIRFPTPKAKATGPIVDYILDGAPVFFIPVEIPATARPGERVRVSADAYWLICDDVCVPEEATLSLDIPIAEDVGAEKAFVAAARRTHPTPLPGEATFAAEPDLLVLRIASETLDGADISFFPEAEGLVRPAAAQTDVRRDGVAALGMAPDFNYDPDGLERLIGVLRVERNGRAVGYEIDATRADLDPRLAAALADRLAGRADGGPSSGSSSEPVSLTGWLLAVGAALIGGLVLNLMPCVFPIVFLKAAGVADAAARGEAGEVRAHALLYAGGVLSSFLALAALLYGFRAAGADIGWGFHLQSPAVIGVLTVIMTLVGLHLAGLFETGAGLQRAGGALLGTMGGKGGAFLTGVLAVALAAPCVGPFVGGALGLAVAQPGFGGLLVFAGLGLGLGGPRRVIEIKRDAGASLGFERRGDRRVAVRPVADDISRVGGAEGGLHGGARQNRLLVELAGDAPGRGEFNEHRPAVGAQGLDRILCIRHGLQPPARGRGAGVGLRSRRWKRQGEDARKRCDGGERLGGAAGDAAGRRDGERPGGETRGEGGAPDIENRDLARLHARDPEKPKRGSKDGKRQRLTHPDHPRA